MTDSALPEPVTPIARSRRVTLLPMSPEWFSFVYGLACENVDSWRWLEPIGSPPAFVASLQQSTLVQAVVIHAAEPVGFVWCFDANHSTKQAHIAAYYTTGSHRTGVPFEGTAVFIDHLFATFGFTKLYANTTDPSSWTRLTRIVSIEGQLHEHCYFEGAWRDFFMIAIPRDSWVSELARLRTFYSPRNPRPPQ
jgi:hypothetical protein